MKTSSSIKFSSLQKPSELWPKGLEGLLKHLLAAGFTAESGTFGATGFLACDAQKYSTKLWKRLEFARAFSGVASATSAGSTVVGSGEKAYAFLGANAKVGESVLKFDLLFVDEKYSGTLPPDIFCVRTNFVEAAFDSVLRALWRPEWVAKTARRVGEKTTIGSKTVIESGALVGPYCKLGKNVVIEAGVRVGAYVTIGDHTRIGACSRIADHSVIGSHCHFQSHVSIGTAGFGVLKGPASAFAYERLHLGRSIIGDHVRLGVFSAVDRGVFADTVFMSHGVTDNFIHVAHNCEVGEGALMCAFVGLGGSVKVGRQVTIAGFTGTTDHIEIGDQVTVGAQSGISRDVASNQVVKGYPPRPLRTALKISALIDRLPDLYERIKHLEENNK